MSWQVQVGKTYSLKLTLINFDIAGRKCIVNLTFESNHLEHSGDQVKIILYSGKFETGFFYLFYSESDFSP